MIIVELMSFVLAVFLLHHAATCRQCPARLKLATILVAILVLGGSVHKMSKRIPTFVSVDWDFFIYDTIKLKHPESGEWENLTGQLVFDRLGSAPKMCMDCDPEFTKVGVSDACKNRTWLR